MAHDITERKQAEKELITSHQTFLTVLDGINATIYVADMDTHEILFMNKHMIESFGSDFTGRICYECFEGKASPVTIAPMTSYWMRMANPLVFVPGKRKIRSQKNGT